MNLKHVKRIITISTGFSIHFLNKKKKFLLAFIRNFQDTFIANIRSNRNERTN